VKSHQEHCEILVIGSGPGGATTACLLSEAGHDVMLVEEGEHFSISSAEPHSLQEMEQKYRNGGLTPTIGKNKVTYIEANCVGGASEINSALYNRAMPQTLNYWQEKYQVTSLDEESLIPFFEQSERELTVSPFPEGSSVGTQSLKIQQGAEKLGWSNEESRRCWNYAIDPSGKGIGTKQSMTQTLIPRAQSAGCRLISKSKVIRLHHDGTSAQYAIVQPRDSSSITARSHIHFKYVFICAGAIQTPAILRRSRITKNIGNALRMHPMAKMTALFEDDINTSEKGVPAVQIQEFKPEIVIGGSYSSRALLSLGMNNVPDRIARLEDWKKIAIYYISTTSNGKGTIRSIPLLHEAFVRYSITKDDLQQVGKAMFHMGELLFAADAVEVYTGIFDTPVIRNLQELERVKHLKDGDIELTTLHLSSSCPMGEDKSKCAVDSYGRLHQFDNVYLNDSSILPEAPGVGPQATIMGVARRNVDRFLTSLGQ
jgi:choline dehydrogenase-like flavoprotein